MASGAVSAARMMISEVPRLRVLVAGKEDQLVFIHKLKLRETTQKIELNSLSLAPFFSWR